MEQAADHILLRKLDDFIRKYYKNRLIRGGLWVLASLGAFYLLMVILEYFFRFGQTGRTLLFFLFLGCSFFLLARLVLVPLLQLMRIGRIITHDQAAMIVGTHFPEIQDKLLNTLQLIRMQRDETENSTLLAAGIGQKTGELKVFRFTRVIDFRKNLAYLRYAMVPLAAILLLVVFSPKTISEPTRRIIHFSQAFIKPLPFRVELLNRSLSAVQQEDFDIRIRITGEEIPSEVYLRTGDIAYRMVRGKDFGYSYLLKSLQGNVRFRIVAGDFTSDAYEITVFPRPIILSFDVLLKYPAYINKPGEKVDNIGDFTVPEGTQITWEFNTRDVSSVKFRLDNERSEIRANAGGTFTYTARVMKSFSYAVTPANASSSPADSLAFRINAIPDGYPSVFVTESVDTTLATSIFFKGTIKDDYGFTKLTFNYSLFERGDTTRNPVITVNIPVEKSINNQVFYYSADLMRLMPFAGQNIRYYFEIWDNDGIHGPKCTRSEMRTLSTPTISEISQRTQQNENSMNESLEQSVSDARSMKKTVDELSRKLVDQNNVSWQEKKKLEELIRKSEELEKRVEDIKKKSEENLRNEEKYLETSSRILEKQKQLEEMMDQLLTEEMKRMIEEMKALLDQVDKNKLSTLLDKMKLTNKDLENQIDRNLALMKQIAFDRKLEDLVKEMRKAAEEQENLAENTEKEQLPQEELLKKQESINEKADSLAKQLQQLKEEGKQLETPADLGNTKPKEDSLKKSLADSKGNLEKKKNKEASGAQKKAAKQMKDLAAQMEESQQESEDEQMAEDEENLRMILENLVRLSFEQEEMIGVTRVINRSDPRYPAMVGRQKEFGEKLKVMEDSLNAVARRQIVIQPIVTREIANLNQYVRMTLDALDERNISLAVAKQQYTMTSINNLALLLNESIEKMKQQSNMSMSAKSGNKACKKPSGKGGKMSLKGMKDLQEKIGQQLQKLKENAEQARKQGMGSKQGQSSVNREVARLAAQQEALRNEMEKYRDEMGTKGTRDEGNMNDAVKAMEQNEKDLINKNITQETLLRQQKIMARMLESEKAEQTREQEEKRQSTEAKDQKISNPGAIYQYNSKNRAGEDNIQLVLPYLNSYYKSKVNSYIVKIEH